MGQSGFEYTGEHLNEISFPLGGIGTGCVGLAGNGRLIDWEIFNRPNKGAANGYSHLAVRCEDDTGVLDARMLQGDLPPPYSGAGAGFGFGPARETLAGMPHFSDVTFSGEYPFARLAFCDDAFPGRVSLVAFNPLIPGDADASGLPAAFFEVTLENTTEKNLLYTAAFTLGNPFGPKTGVNRLVKSSGRTALVAGCRDIPENSIRYGDITVMTDAPDTSYQQYWYRAHRFNSLGVFWRDFTAPGGLRNRVYGEETAGFNDAHDTGTLAAHLRLAPGEAQTVRFVLAWHFPNCRNTWNEQPCRGEGCGCEEDNKDEGQWKNHYATRFASSLQTAGHALENWATLRTRTLRFKQLLFGSTLPPAVLDAVAANISILKSPTCLRLEKGELYGFEGCSCGEGCCEGSCTHVWNYAYAAPFLFPALERSMQELDYRYNQDEDGGMHFRLQLPLGRQRSAFQPCADGQFGGVMRVWRNWKLCGDDAWLRQMWPAVKRSVEYAWSENNPCRWDRDRDGVLEGRQHHTLDLELFGPNAWLTGFYLGALQCGAQMARHLGEEDTAEAWRALYRNGRAWAEENLFNGEYFTQKVNLEDKSVLQPYLEADESILAAYWNDEAGELKHQIGDGCGIDQVLAQWHASVCGMDEIYSREKVQSALRAIYRHNYKPTMRGLANPCRLYGLNDEPGTVICEWPQGTRKPAVPILYAEETMHGFEYQAAAHMIMEGMEEQGLRLVQAVRGKYDGKKRNPWNEIECGSNYARSMASYSLLLACSGFGFNLPEGYIGFAPRTQTNGRACFFWSVGTAWGSYEEQEGAARLWVEEGALELRSFGITKPVASVLCPGGQAAGFTFAGGRVSFAGPVRLAAREALVFLW